MSYQSIFIGVLTQSEKNQFIIDFSPNLT